MGLSAPDERDPHWLSPAVPPRYVPAIDNIIIGIVVMFCFFLQTLTAFYVVDIIEKKILTVKGLMHIY